MRNIQIKMSISFRKKSHDNCHMASELGHSLLFTILSKFLDLKTFLCFFVFQHFGAKLMPLFRPALDKSVNSKIN